MFLQFGSRETYDFSAMKRRQFMTMLAAFPAVSAALIPEELRGQQNREAAAELIFSSADVAAQTTLEFFTNEQFSALSRVSDKLMPPMDGMPGALDARVPEFFDFLIGASPPDRQRVYCRGLDAINGRSRDQFGRPYSEISDNQATTMLSPLLERWTYRPSADPVSALLWTAKMDVRTATQNSVEWDQAAAADGGAGRRGQYWLPID